MNFGLIEENQNALIQILEYAIFSVCSVKCMFYFQFQFIFSLIEVSNR